MKQETQNRPLSPSPVSSMAIAQTFMQLLHSNLAFNPPLRSCGISNSVL